MKTIPIIQILSKFGIQPSSIKGNDFWYHSWTRKEKTASLKVDTRQNLFYDFGIGRGGSVIDVTMQLLGFREVGEALVYLESFEPSNNTKHLQASSSEDNKRYYAEKGTEIKRVHQLKHPALLSYAKSRKVNLSYLIQYCNEVHYNIGDKKYFAIGFENNLGGFELRNSIFKSCSSPKSFSILKSGNFKLIIFEGFFDFLSLLTSSDKSRIGYDYLILNSISFADKIDQNVLNFYDEIYLFLDNDSAGEKTKEIFFSKKGKYTDCSILYRPYKDVNEWLMNNKL